MSSLNEPGAVVGKRRTVTLQDVADEAGVAVSTASRALANPDRVSLATRQHVQSVAMRLGYKHIRMTAFPEAGRTPMLALLVADITNPSNFDVIRTYNNSTAYALSVGLLGDAVTGSPGPVAQWPVHDRPLTATQIQRLQVKLEKMGYDVGKVDAGVDNAHPCGVELRAGFVGKPCKQLMVG